MLKRLFGKRDPRAAMAPLYAAVVGMGRQPHWYSKGQVPDTLDGRFDMIAAMLTLVLLRLEEEPDKAQEGVWLTELFVDDMDGQLRQIGIGDIVVGKHIGRMMSALGGRLTAYRAAVKGEAPLGEALVRNLYRGEAPDADALAYTSDAFRDAHAALAAVPVDAILAGRLS